MLLRSTEATVRNVFHRIGQLGQTKTGGIRGSCVTLIVYITKSISIDALRMYWCSTGRDSPIIIDGSTIIMLTIVLSFLASLHM